MSGPDRDGAVPSASGDQEHRLNVNDLLTSGAVVSCWYSSHLESNVARPDCEGLASVVYGRIPLCHECDLRRSAVGKGVVPVALASPDALVEVLAARDAQARAEAALNASVIRARRAGHPWTVIGAILGISRQGAQQRFARAHGPGGGGGPR
ncbi:MAG: hypothetical protein ACRD0E_09900 [Acidimicrobiales bacterium]